MSAFLEIPSFIFSLVGKFASAFVLFTGLVLFVPDELAKSMSLEVFREENTTVLWLVFLLSFSMLVSYLGKEIWMWAYPLTKKWLATRKRHKLKIARLASLGDRERMWIACCLYFNQQTMNAPYTALPPSALRSKGLLVAGEGHMLDVPFSIPDDLWEHLQTVKSDFVPEGMNNRERQKYEQELQGYRRSLQPY